MPEPAGISLPMMMFSLRPIRLSPLAVDGGLGEHPGGLLERRRRQPRLGGQRCLGDAHDLGPTLGRLLALLDHALLVSRKTLASARSPGRNDGVAGLLHADAAGHLAHDQLDVLVADRHTLVAVHLLDLFDEVRLGLADALDLHDLLRVEGTVGDRLAGLDVLTIGDDGAAAGGQDDRVLFALIVDDGDRDALALVLADAHDTAGAGQAGRTAGRAALEQLDDARQTAGDVLALATPPVWKVRMVSWVPGSPIDWAAMTPTASPSSIDLPVASERP